MTHLRYEEPVCIPPGALTKCGSRGDCHDGVWVTYQCAQTVRPTYHQARHAASHAVVVKILELSPRPIPQIVGSGKLAQWRGAFPTYCTTRGANTAAPKRSTADRACTAGSPEASPTATTSACACSPEEARTHDPTKLGGTQQRAVAAAPSG